MKRADTVASSFAQSVLAARVPIEKDATGDVPPLVAEKNEYLVPVGIVATSATVLTPGMYVVLRKGVDKEKQTVGPARIVSIASKGKESAPAIIVIALSETLSEVDGWTAAIVQDPPKSTGASSTQP